MLLSWVVRDVFLDNFKVVALNRYQEKDMHNDVVANHSAVEVSSFATIVCQSDRNVSGVVLLFSLRLKSLTSDVRKLMLPEDASWY